MTEKPCVCETHIFRDAELKKAKRQSLHDSQAMLARLPKYIEELEKEINAPEFKETKRCLGHGQGCPCTEKKIAGMV